MTDLMWTPAAIAELTLTQLVCLCNERVPGDDGGPKKTWEEMAAALAKQAAEAEAWAAPGSGGW